MMQKAVALYTAVPKLHNCAQAVAAGCDAEEELVGELAACGGGKADCGRCGALHGALRLTDAVHHDAIRRRFAEKAGAETCREIKSGHHFSCSECVRLGATLAMRYSATRRLAKEEAARYGVDAVFVSDKELPSFELRLRQGKVVIAAPSDVEWLYGVYEFAERFGGWSFFEPGRDVFRREDVVCGLPDGVLLAARKPLLERRGFIQEFPFNAETPQLFDYMAKKKLNYIQTWMKYYDHLQPELKEMAQARGIEIESGHHNFDYWISGVKYGETHPEFFAEIGGRRISPSGGKSALLLSEQLCTTNPDLRAEIVKNMIDYCDNHPEVRHIALIPNDGFGWCECENCSKFYDKTRMGETYSVSAHVYKADRIYHDMFQDIAARLHAVRPDVTLAICAYVNYTAPAPGFKLMPGMAVHFAPYWRCINHALDDESCPTNAGYVRDIKAWQQANCGGEFNIYEYYMGINFYLSLPMIHFEKMFREMKFYAQHGVGGIMTQFHIAHWSVYGVNFELMGRAARGENATEAIAETMHKLFGADAVQGEALYRSMEKMMQTMGHCHIPYPYSLFRRTEVEDFERLLEQARKLADRDENSVFRKEITIWCEYLLRFKRLFDEYHAGRVLTRDVVALQDWIHSFKDSRIFVHDKFDMYFGAWISAIESGREWLHFNLDWEDEYIRQHRTLLG